MGLLCGAGLGSSLRFNCFCSDDLQVQAFTEKEIPSRFWESGAAVLYAVLFISGVAWVQEIGGDITAVLCLFFVGILESCVRCGLIQTNTGYDQLFEVCTLGAQITDQNYNVCYASANAMPLSKKTMKDAVEKDVVIDKKTRIQNQTIRGRSCSLAGRYGRHY